MTRRFSNARIVLVATTVLFVGYATFAQGAKPAPRNANEPEVSGPLGFRKGETAAEILKIVGRKAIEKQANNLLILNSSPAFTPDFTRYYLLFQGPGLISVSAASHEVDDCEGRDSGGYGCYVPLRRVLKQFNEIKDHLVAKYGAPTTCISKSEEEQTCNWFLSSHPMHIESIKLESSVLENQKWVGWSTIDYRFEGFEEFSRSKAKNSPY